MPSPGLGFDGRPRGSARLGATPIFLRAGRGIPSTGRRFERGTPGVPRAVRMGASGSSSRSDREEIPIAPFMGIFSTPFTVVNDVGGFGTSVAAATLLGVGRLGFCGALFCGSGAIASAEAFCRGPNRVRLVPASPRPDLNGVMPMLPGALVVCGVTVARRLEGTGGRAAFVGADCVTRATPAIRRARSRALEFTPPIALFRRGDEASVEANEAPRLGVRVTASMSSRVTPPRPYVMDGTCVVSLRARSSASFAALFSIVSLCFSRIAPLLSLEVGAAPESPAARASALAAVSAAVDGKL